MKTYKKHLESRKSFGEKQKSTRKPVYRGSAIFTIFESPMIKTRILFMGYWMLKNNIRELGLLITFRNEYGEILSRESDLINSHKPFEILVSDYISSKENEFIGSIELEIFSAIDLFFPYPAFVVNYFNKYSSCSVHTVGRIYNDYEDLIDNSTQTVKEAGFDLLPGKNFDPFFTFTNGFLTNNSFEFELEIINFDNKSFLKEIKFGELKPLQTCVIKIKDHLNLDEILNNKVGTIKIHHNLKGFFPRFICGNINKETSSISLTHSFYDSSKITSSSSYWINNNKDLMYDSTVFIPLFLDNDYYTDLKFYPIYSPSVHKVDIIFYDENGNKLLNLKEVLEIKKNNFLKLNFKEIAIQNNLDLKNVKGALLTKKFEDKIPTRLKYGLNVGKLKSEYNMPTNICFASHVSNDKIINKPGTFKWLPILNHGHSIAVIENSSFIVDYKKIANVLITFYRVNSTETINEKIKIPANGQKRIYINSKIKQFLKNKSGWLTVKSDNPFVKAWYFEFNESGIFGGDHSF